MNENATPVLGIDMSATQCDQVVQNGITERMAVKPSKDVPPKADEYVDLEGGFDRDSEDSTGTV
jgi:hypothetical protein